jgi:23S rRNA pseudouridine1911/1915/1917 synthase
VRAVAGPEDAGQRADRWLSRCFPEFSRARIQTLMRAGRVTTAAGAPLAPDDRVSAGLAAEVRPLPRPEPAARPEDIPLDVLYEDADLLVVNKPAGLVVHPAPGHPGGTLVNALLHACPEMAGAGADALRPGIVHRLDRDTSGALVVAKTESAALALSRQFAGREVEKRYAALVHGEPRPARGRIETVIGRSRSDRKKMSARVARGREAVTEYEVVERLGPLSLVAVRILTGRTHQIRVHMAHIGCPVAGDRAYGRPALDRRLPAPPPRQMLHAEDLAFRHPRTGAALRFHALRPADFEALAASLRA